MATINFAYVNINSANTKIKAQLTCNVSPTESGFLVSYSDSGVNIGSYDLKIDGGGTTYTKVFSVTNNTHIYVRAYMLYGGNYYYDEDLTSIDAKALPRISMASPYTLHYDSCGSYTLNSALFFNGGYLVGNYANGCSDKTQAYYCDKMGVFYTVDSQQMPLYTGDDFATLPTVTTTTISNISCNTASGGGNVTSDGDGTITAKGVCWNTTGSPTTSNSKTNDGSGTGSFTSSLTSLSSGTLYYVRAYATNSAGTSYGNQVTFTTSSVAVATVTTTSITNISGTTASGGGNVTSENCASVTDRGICWSTSPNPTTANSHTHDGSGSGSFTSSLTGLVTGTTYYVRAYAINWMGTSYGSQVTFTTLGYPVITTTAITDILQTTATGGGNVTNGGLGTVIARGICWSTSPNPTTANSKTIQTGTTGSFVSYMTGLTEQTLYYVRAYATNTGVGTGYGNELTFSTIGDLPTVFTSGITITSLTGASGGGIVLTSGDTAVTARGVCWATTANPTIANSKTVNGSGLGAFASTLTGLTVNTPYYVRAYATSDEGTSYGNQETFEIVFDAPTLTGSTSGNSINLQITDNNTYKEHYEIYYSGYSSQGTFVPFSETSGTNANDYGYNGFDGTLYGTTFVNSGRTGYCAYISNALRYVDFGNHFQFNVDTVPFTIALWVNRKTALSNIDVLGTAYSSNGYVFGFGNLATASDKLHFYRTGSSGWGRFVYANQALGSGWHHLAVTYDGSNTASGITLYYDGNKLTTIVYSDISAGGGHETFRIGTRGFADNFIGLVEDFRVFDKELSEENILNIYNDGTNEYITTIDSPDTTYADTGLTCGDYSYLTRCKIDSVSPTIYSDFSNVYSENLIIPPSGLTGTSITFTGMTLSWTNTNTGCIDGSYIESNVGGTWITIGSVTGNTSTLNVTGLTPNTYYIFRVISYSGTNEQISNNFDFYTLNPAPYDLQATGITITTADLIWNLIDTPPFGDSIKVYLKQSTESNYVLVATLPWSATTHTLTGLTYNRTYNVYVVRVDGIDEYESNIETFTTANLPLSFCDGNNYYVTGSTCGNADGIIVIFNTLYFQTYDFILSDISGNTYIFDEDTGIASGLTSGYYFLTASAKPEYWGVYGRDYCEKNWIIISDTDNPMYLASVKVKPTQCLSFDIQTGRIFFNVSGLTTGNTYTFNAYLDDFTLYLSKTGCTGTTQFVIENSPPVCYHALIIDEISGCKLPLSTQCIISLPTFSQGGVKKLFIMPWNTNVDYDYWSTAEEDYFLEFEDTSFFLSTKIKQYYSATGGTGYTWYSLPVFPQVCKLEQKLSKVRQGYIFTDTLTLAVNYATAAKWLKMKDVLSSENKWIFVVQDADGYWWTGGYRHGASISTYTFTSGARGEDNGYQLVISAISENKLLTALDENYVNNYILK